MRQPNTTLEADCLVSCMMGQALDGMCVGLILTNAAGRVEWMNRSAERILGLDRAASHGELLQHELRDPSLTEFWHRACQVDDVLMGEVVLHWPAQCDLKVNMSNCTDGAGQSIGRALLFCDITTERSAQIELSREATERLLEMAGSMRPNVADSPHSGLTPQELRILRLVGRGMSNDEIARELHLATSTVRTHLKHVYSKLGLLSRPEAISYAIRHGLVEH